MSVSFNSFEKISTTCQLHERARMNSRIGKKLKKEMRVPEEKPLERPLRATYSFPFLK